MEGLLLRTTDGQRGYLAITCDVSDSGVLLDIKQPYHNALTVGEQGLLSIMPYWRDNPMACKVVRLAGTQIALHFL
jgi:hypothetical protein